MRSAHVLAGSLLAAMALPVSGQDGHRERDLRERAANVAKIAAAFATFAGSEDNAVALVESLHEATPVKLVYPAPDDAVPAVLALEPPTCAMDWTDVRTALMLARDALLGVGVSRPSGEQLEAVLMGGRATIPSGRTIAFRGVLQMRAEGLNWGQVASQRYQRPAIERIE